MTDLNIDTLMDLLPQLFRPDQAQGINAVINFELSGDQGGIWSLSIHDQKCVVNQAGSDHPDLTLHARDKDILDIFTGRLSASRAVLLRRLRMSGDMSLAMKILGLFNTDDPRLRQWRQ